MDEEHDILVARIDNEINLRAAARETTDESKRTIKLLLSISLAVILFLAYRIYDIRYWVDVLTCSVFALGMLPYGLWIITSSHAENIKLLTYDMEKISPEYQMIAKAGFWKSKRLAEEEERDIVLKHTRRYTRLFAVFIPLAIVMLIVSPLTEKGEEYENPKNEQEQHE